MDKFNQGNNMEQTKVSGRGLLQQKFQQEEQQKKPSLGKNILGGIAKLQTIPAELGIGGLKGIISTARGIGTLGEKAITAVLPKKAEEFFGFEPRLTTAERLIPESITETKTPLEKVGKITEQIGEFMIPVGGEARALQALTKVVPKAPAIIRGLTRMAGVGAEFAGKTALQTGGELKEVGISGAIGAVSPIVGKIAGAIAKPIAEKFPERLMSIIFKTAENDLRQMYRTISKGEEINPTLAKEALERGLKGNSQNMAVYSFQKLDQLEKQVQEAVKDKAKTIIIENKSGFINILNSIKKQFQGGFFSNRAKTADLLISELKKSKGNNIAIDSVLKIRRFIDKMRNTSSFRINPLLSAKQEEFKGATNYLRKKLADAGLKDLMNEERVYIEFLDSIISDASKRMNRNVLGLFDLLAGGGGMAAGAPLAGISAALAVRGFQQPFTLTNLAQALYKLRNIPNVAKLFPAIPPIINQTQ